MKLSRCLGTLKLQSLHGEFSALLRSGKEVKEWVLSQASWQSWARREWGLFGCLYGQRSHFWVTGWVRGHTVNFTTSIWMFYILSMKWGANEGPRICIIAYKKNVCVCVSVRGACMSGVCGRGVSIKVWIGRSWTCEWRKDSKFETLVV